MAETQIQIGQMLQRLEPKLLGQLQWYLEYPIFLQQHQISQPAQQRQQVKPVKKNAEERLEYFLKF